MIRNEGEYQEAVKRLTEEQATMAQQKKALEAMAHTPAEVQRAMEPLISFHQQLKDEIEWYESVKRGDVQTIERINDIGKILIALRIAQGMTQKELASRLGVSEAQVSRDERNDYHGITVERVQKILDAINGKLEIKLYHLPPRPHQTSATA